MTNRYVARSASRETECSSFVAALGAARALTRRGAVATVVRVGPDGEELRLITTVPSLGALKR